MSTYSANINKCNEHTCTTIMIVLSIVILYIITYCERTEQNTNIHLLVLDIYTILLYLNVLANYTVVM